MAKENQSKRRKRALIKAFIKAVDVRAKRQERAPYGLGAQGISNLLWALAKLVENGRLQLYHDRRLLSEAVTALLRQVVTPPEPFISQHISNLLWALAKLVDNGQIQRNQDSHLLSEVVTALLPQVVTPPEPFILSTDLQPAVGAGETGGERTDSTGSGQPTAQ